ncbi:Hsp20/alpha crystallin family protein [Winogradskyella ursingii]|uniref:Hsp20/alpha crystallin family protein n=1 Tax=Winogradskyella ursingii TaxID=2686079 RepID=UPI001C53CB11|nr:Hsp20/alpha crystallin family protein [Winogradskyella ursingii]
MTMLKSYGGGFYPTFLENFFENSWDNPNLLFNSSSRTPAVNIKETDDCFCIDVAAPGMKRDDFDISVENDRLTISASAEESSEDSDDNYTKREFSYSSFTRYFQLPDSVDDDDIEANYNDGVLNINIPKKESAKPKPRRSIKVNSSKELSDNNRVDNRETASNDGQPKHESAEA